MSQPDHARNGLRNVLFIMCDQLRWDHLGCSGHPTLRTPNIDALAARGVRFERAFVQAPVCGGSRNSFYTGRYAFSHGAYYNNFPLRVDEWLPGDYLAPLGVRSVLVGKTHHRADADGLTRLGVDAGSAAGRHVLDGGFEPWERDDGLYPEVGLKADQAYQVYLREHGYDARNPWHDFANSAAGPAGEVLSGWHMRNARLPARVAEVHSETAYMTDRALAAIEALGDTPWCLHLSYIKPHWPYMAPAPYHAMYSADDILPANRSEAERSTANPVMAAFMRHPESECFAREAVRRTVIPTYMGLVSQIDHHLGRLFDALARSGRAQDTLVVFTSDHGDYLGDHWLGEKDLFHEAVVRVPLIVADPSAAADATRGSASDVLVEAIDLLPTFIDALGGRPPAERLEGRSLLPWLRGETPDGWRDAVFCDGHFGLRHARRHLGLTAAEARAFMVRTRRWKYVEFIRHAPQLFDLQADPDERHDLGRDPDHTAVREEMSGRLRRWMMQRRLLTTVPDERIEAMTGKAHERGYLFGVW